MRYLANPIYDAVFKFMMEDEEVAKRFIGTLIDKNIIKLTLLPQEKTYLHDDLKVRIHRLDFIAFIEEADGSQSKILIELQKSNKSYHADIMRFRGYLAKQYAADDLPIVTIYLLGFILDKDLPPSTFAKRDYYNLSTKEKLNHKNEFIEKLSHDCYVIQIPLLQKPLQTKIDYLLSIFDQSQVYSKDKEGKKVIVLEDETAYNDLKKIVDRLAYANGDEKIRQQIEDEEYIEQAYDEMFGRIEAENAILSKNLEASEKALEVEKQRAEQLEKSKIQAIQKAMASGISLAQIKEIFQVEESFLRQNGLLE